LDATLQTQFPGTRYHRNAAVVGARTLLGEFTAIPRDPIAAFEGAVSRVRTDIKTLFSRTFQDLRRRNSRVFQDSKKLVFEDFPGYTPYTNMVAS